MANKSSRVFWLSFIIGNLISYSENKNDIKELCNDEAEIGGLLSYLENLSLNSIYIFGDNDTPTIFKEPYPFFNIKAC